MRRDAQRQLMLAVHLDRFRGGAFEQPGLVARFVDVLGRFFEKPLIDMTGAPENTLYDITIEVQQEDYLRMLIRAGLNSGAAIPPEAARMAEGTPESFFAEMDKIGLKLDARKTMLDVVVVDKADRNPVEN